MSIRRAIVWASTGQYLVLALNFSVTLLLARLLTPFEFGVYALGTAVTGIAEAVREVAGGTFLIRENDLTAEKIRTSATLNFLLTVVLAVGIVGLAHPLAAFFDLPALVAYLQIAVIGFCAGPLLNPQQALLTRDMSFKRLSAINVAAALAGAATSTGLALAGFGADSFAWAGVVTAIATAGLGIALGRGLTIYVPCLRCWRIVLGFGVHSSATAIVARLAEALPLIVFGRLLGPSDLAIGHRAIILCQIPERLIAAVFGLVVLPELSRLTREGGDVSRAYLVALANVTALHWPAMLMLALLAKPVVVLLLGNEWMDAVPLVMILSIALMLATPMMLQYPALVAAGGVRVLPRLIAVQTAVTTAALAATASYGLRAAALAMLVVMPINAAMSLIAVRAYLPFSGGELARAMFRSALVAIAACAVPSAISLHYSVGMPVAMAVLASVLAAAGWLCGLAATRHPLWNEIARAAASFDGARRLRR